MSRPIVATYPDRRRQMLLWFCLSIFVVRVIGQIE
jgi:hypothetical protein